MVERQRVSLPYLAGEAITAGEAVMSSAAADLTVLKATAAKFVPLGFALTDAASGDICSVITGKGVILNVQCLPTTGSWIPANGIWCNRR